MDCPACKEKRVHTEEEWKLHPEATHGYTRVQGWTGGLKPRKICVICLNPIEPDKERTIIMEGSRSTLSPVHDACIKNSCRFCRTTRHIGVSIDSCVKDHTPTCNFILVPQYACNCGGPPSSFVDLQPAPSHNALPAVWDLVIKDMRSRDEYGRAKYNTPLQPNNGRDALLDAYQEALDLCVYLRQVIYERDRSAL